MKVKLWLGAFLAVILLASFASAESYQVKKGDSLSLIANRYKGVSMKSIQAVNPIIKNIGHIEIGWNLQIPVVGDMTPVRLVAKKSTKVSKKTQKKFSGNQVVVQKSDQWQNPGADRYRGDLKVGLGILGYSGNAQSSIVELVKEDNPTFGIIQHIENGGLVIAQDGTRHKMIKMLGGGGNKPTTLITGPNGVISSWKDKGMLQAAKIYTSGETAFMLPLMCDNPTLIVRVDAPLMEQEIVPPQLSLVIPPIVPAPPATKKCVGDKCDKWDWYVGGGNYESRVDTSDNHGKYGWTKLRYRPICIEPEENDLGIRRIGLGAFGFLSGWDGVAAKYYDYDGKQFSIGSTLKIEAEHSDYDFDLGWGKMWNDGSWMGKKDRDQVDDIILASAHGNFYREDPEALWFRKFELNVEYRHPFNNHTKVGTPSENRVFELMGTQWIYAAELGEDKSLVVSPGINLGLGYDWGADDEDFFQLGPAFEIASYDNVIAGVSIWNYKFQSDGQWHPIGGYISIDGIAKAWKASHITGVSAEDLQGLENGSKLLKNPADYL